MKKVMLLAVAGMLVSAGAAEAQTSQSGVSELCTTAGTSTGLNACVSFFVRTTVVGGNTSVALHAQNSDWNTGNAGPVNGYLINRVAIMAPELTGTIGGFGVTLDGATLGPHAPNWAVDPNGVQLPGVSGIQFIAGTQPGATSNGGIQGASASGGSAGYVTGNSSQWVVFNFTLTGQVLHAGNQQFAYGFKAQAFGDGGSLHCPDDGCTPTVVTPEPVSMVLLATGLMGMGIVARRRRKLDDANA